MADKKKSKKDIKRDRVFDDFMKENYPLIYILGRMGYKIEKINNKEE